TRFQSETEEEDFHALSDLYTNSITLRKNKPEKVVCFVSRSICQTCPKDWIQFQESCYFFNHFISPLKQWDQSRQLCQSMKSDLVVISSLEEQNFIKNKIQYYYDTHHGYWIGLRKVNNKWIWVDGIHQLIHQLINLSINQLTITPQSAFISIKKIYIELISYSTSINKNLLSPLIIIIYHY
uniref:C-type lectin domain-containing protein n=1 Tax=Oryzias latipes TaxID=8090 RepID=A0A3B3IPK0_ORYLA